VLRLNKHEVVINYLVELVQTLTDPEEKKDAIAKLLEKLKPFRYALAKKFSNKGVDFSDVAQQIDLKLIEAIYDYDESKDPSALRHLVSRARNGIWNYYRKEMNYFDEEKITVSLDAVFASQEILDNPSCYYNLIEDGTAFNEDKIIEKIFFEEELAKLTPHQREILFMVFIDDMTQYSIAEELNINQANVSRAKKRGIENIKNNINPLDELDETD
jgi:RNA polymerase sigma factor (sigma-70 family)